MISHWLSKRILTTTHFSFPTECAQPVQNHCMDHKPSDAKKREWQSDVNNTVSLNIHHSTCIVTYSLLCCWLFFHICVSLNLVVLLCFKVALLLIIKLLIYCYFHHVDWKDSLVKGALCFSRVYAFMSWSIYSIVTCSRTIWKQPIVPKPID